MKQCTSLNAFKGKRKADSDGSDDGDADKTELVTNIYKSKR